MLPRLRELERSLTYTGDGPFYLPPHSVGIMELQNRRRRRRQIGWVRAYFAWHGLYVHLMLSMVEEALPDRWLIGYDGKLYPMRPPAMSTPVYETAVTLISDGMDSDDAFETARHLG